MGSSLLSENFEISDLALFGKKLLARSPARLNYLWAQELVDLVNEQKLVLVRGLEPLAREEFLSFAKGFPQSSILEWDFGPVMELQEKLDATNYLFSREAVPFHWDGAFHREPKYLLFSCVEAPFTGRGGETLFSNTESVWESFSDLQKQKYEKVSLTYKTKKLAHYGGEFSTGLLQKHPITGATILRFAEKVETQLNPVTMEVSGLSPEQVEEFVHTLTQRVYEQNHCYAHEWQTGDFLIADNFSLIHGRKAFAENCPRHIRRIQII